MLRDEYVKAYEKIYNSRPDILAIHAGLECGILSSKIEDVDCISIGPDIYDMHTVNERLSISSMKQFFDLLVDMLSKI